METIYIEIRKWKKKLPDQIEIHWEWFWHKPYKREYFENGFAAKYYGFSRAINLVLPICDVYFYWDAEV